MTPISLTVSGFLPFTEEVTIDFTSNPYAIVSGPNGTGKSSLIIDGIIYSLFGEARQKSQGLINSICERSYTCFYFSHKGNECCIKRITEKNRTSKVSFRIGNTDVSERKLTATQEKINQFLGFNKALLLTTCVSGQEDAGLFSAMGPAEREKTLTQLLNLEIWADKKKRTSEWLANVKHEREKVEEIKTDILKLEGELIEYIESKELQEPNIQHLEKEYVRLKSEEEHFMHEAARYDEAARVHDKIIELGNSIVNIGRQLHITEQLPSTQELEEKLNSVLANMHEGDEEVKAANDQVLKWNVELTEARELEAYLQAYKEHDMNAGLLEKVPCVGTPMHGQCELLSHAWQSSHILNVLLEKHGKENLNQLIQDSADSTRRLNEEKCKWVELTQEADLYVKSLWGIRNITQNSLSVAQEREIKLEQQTKWSQELEVLVEKDKHLPQGELVGMHVIQQNKNSIQAELDTARQVMSGIKGEIEWREKKCTELQSILEGMNKSIQEWSYYETLQTAYKEIPASLLYDSVPLIEQYANDILIQISSDSMVQIRIHKETTQGKAVRSIDLVSVSQNGTLPFEALSGSERFRESLAIRIALSRVIAEAYDSPLNFFIMDEGFGCLDQVNTAIVKDVLRGVAKLFKMFYVISHVDNLKDTFPTEILINKESPQVSIQEHVLSQDVVLDR